RAALELAERERRYHMLFQYGNEANPAAHYAGTGAEIAEALDRVDVLVAGLGTGGTLMGAGARLRETFPDVVVAAAEPLPGDPVMGLRSLEDGYVPPILDVSKLDRKLLVSNAESVAGLRELLAREGIFAGVSSGAVVYINTSNGAARPYRFELETEPQNWFLEDEGYELAVFHSHVSSPPRPSRTDVENVGLWEGRPYLILSLGTGELAAWRIAGGEISPLDIG